MARCRAGRARDRRRSGRRRCGCCCPGPAPGTDAGAGRGCDRPRHRRDTQICRAAGRERVVRDRDQPARGRVGRCQRETEAGGTAAAARRAHGTNDVMTVPTSAAEHPARSGVDGTWVGAIFEACSTGSGWMYERVGSRYWLVIVAGQAGVSIFVVLLTVAVIASYYDSTRRRRRVDRRSRRAGSRSLAVLLGDPEGDAGVQRDHRAGGRPRPRGPTETVDAWEAATTLTLRQFRSSSAWVNTSWCSRPARSAWSCSTWAGTRSS